MEIINALQSALVNEEFRLHYQPQVDGRTKQVIGFEALIRWAHPTKGFLSAGEIIPVRKIGAYCSYRGMGFKDGLPTEYDLAGKRYKPSSDGS